MTEAAKTRRRLLTDLRRSEILAAALKVFCRKGYENSRMDDVAAQAKIAKGTLYLYFKSKEEIYTAAMQEAIEQFETLAEERLSSIDNPQAQFRTLVEVRLGFWEEQKGLYRMLLTVGRTKQHGRQTQTFVRNLALRFRAIMQAAMDRGEIAEQPLDPLAFALVDMMRGVTERRIEGVSKTTLSEDAEAISHIAFATLGWPASGPQTASR